MNTQSETDRNDSHTALGADLKAARERRGWSLHQVSQELHIGDTILEALERGDYASLGAPIFVRGHLRNYARLLGMGEEEVLARYETESDKPTAPPLVTQKQDSGMRRSSPWLFSIVVLVVLLVLAVAWWTHRENHVQSQLTGVASPAAGTASVPIAAAPDNMPAVNAPGRQREKPAVQPEKHKAEPAKQPVVAAPQRQVNKTVKLPPAQKSAVKSRTEAAGTTAPGQTQVKFTLKQASWIEVYDVSGKRLYYDLAPAGDSINVSGAGPLQVFLGNSPGVSIQLNGKPFDQTAYTRVDNTARFKLGGAAPTDKQTD